MFGSRWLVFPFCFHKANEPRTIHSADRLFSLHIPPTVEIALDDWDEILDKGFEIFLILHLLDIVIQEFLEFDSRVFLDVEIPFLPDRPFHLPKVVFCFSLFWTYRSNDPLACGVAVIDIPCFPFLATLFFRLKTAILFHLLSFPFSFLTALFQNSPKLSSNLKFLELTPIQDSANFFP